MRASWGLVFEGVGDDEVGRERAEMRYDILFLMAGRPLPSQLQMAAEAQGLGLATLMVVLERRLDDLVIDAALVQFDLKCIEVPYKSVDLQRLVSTPRVFWKLKEVVVNSLRPAGTIVTSSYDLLLFGRILAVGRRYKLRHEVSDMTTFQLSGSWSSRAMVWLERGLLRRVERVIVRSPAFATEYYAKIYKGKVVFVSNMPAKHIWAGFRRVSVEDGCFRVGFIGIIRYKQSMLQLIDAVRQLTAEGLSVKVVFAGGGGRELMKWAQDIMSSCEFLGPYEYTKDIKKLYSGIDLTYAVYDSADRNCQLALPTKFYESIITKTPILVAKNTFVEREVVRLGIGGSVLTGDVIGLVDLLRKAIVKGDWYARALDKLHSIDVDQYFDSVEQGIRESVLP